MEPELTSKQASAEAVHTAKNAAQSLETARQVQLAEAVALTVSETNRQTKETLVAALKEVFGRGDSSDPEQMTLLAQKIPLVCLNIQQMHSEITELKDSQIWAVRVVVGLFIAALAKLVFMP